ncbi:MAG: ArsR family transcriptional regulator, partial [Veillonella sp.]|nr:ArsR family transcriptional regulator [Veillonella sp.]
QSSISTFMSILENAELVESRKIDQYTYFRRNEEVIREFGEWYNKEVSIQSDEIDKLLETVILEDTSYPATEERSIPSEQLAVEIRTKGPHHDEESK